MGDDSFLMRVPFDLFEKIDGGQLAWTIVTPEGEFLGNLRTITPTVDLERCIACGRCEDSCAYSAVQVRLTTDPFPVAVVNREICKQCGGCAAVCPSGAIGQGPLSLNALAERLLEIIGLDPNEPVLSAAYWTVRQAAMDNKILELVCNRMLTPGLMIRALALGSPGMLILAPPEEVGCHYLPSSRDIGEVVERMKQLLEFVDVDPARIGLKEGIWSGRKILMDEFKEELPQWDRPGIRKNLPPPPEYDSPIIDIMTQLEYLAGTSEDAAGTFSMGDRTSFGYMEYLNKLLSALGLSVLDEMDAAIRNIRERQGSGKDLPTMMDLAVHLSVSSFFTDRSPARTDKLWRREKICLLRCPDDDIYGAEIFARILENIPNVSIVQIRTEYSGTDWFRFTRSLRREVDSLLREAEENNADLLLTVSPFPTAAMRLLTCTGSWERRNVTVRDVISFLAASINGASEGMK